MTPTEESLFRGAARTVLNTGVPVSIRFGTNVLADLDTILAENLPAHRVLVADLDRCDATESITELRSALPKIIPELTLPADTTFTGLQAKESGRPIGALFKNHRALGTSMIWIAFFMCLLMINGVSIWLPKLMVTAGYALNSSLIFMIVLNAGTIVGTLALGKLADMLGVKRV